MKKLADQISRSIASFEKEILPRATRAFTGAEDVKYLQERLGELRRLHEQAGQAPVFSIRFLGDTQNGKSTLINVLLGRKVLPEGHVGACSAAIVRCCYRDQPKITLTFRYNTEKQFLADLEKQTKLSELALEEEASDQERWDSICNFLGRFLKLLDIKPSDHKNPVDLVRACREHALDFPERALLGQQEVVEATPEMEPRIRENLSAQGRRAFIVDECLIHGAFPHWHRSMELVDMPGTNAFNPWDDQVNERLQQRVGGLAIVTQGTQLSESVMAWFKETTILSDVAGASERNQVRLFVLKTFVDQLNLPDDDNSEKTPWQLTQAYCSQIEPYLRGQVVELIEKRFSAPNELDVLKRFVKTMPVHFLSAKVYRNLADDGLRNRVLSNPTNPKNSQLFTNFQQFDQNAANTGVPELQRGLFEHTETFITRHFRTKLELEFRKEVGLVTKFFRGKRLGIERRLAQEGAFVIEVERRIRADLDQVIKAHRQSAENKVVDLKNRFAQDIGALLDQVTAEFGKQTRAKLDDWLHLHWASLRCAGNKNGQHTTARGYEIDFNGALAEIAVRALNSSWITHRASLRKLLYNDLADTFLPAIEKVVAQAKGQDEARIRLIESNYEPVAESAREELALQVEKYDSETAEFDALRPTLTLKIRNFLAPTYDGIASEKGKNSSIRMRRHLSDGVQKSVQQIAAMVKQAVTHNWQGLTGTLEARVSEFFETVECGLEQTEESLRALSEHPLPDDEDKAAMLRGLEKATEKLAGKTGATKEAA